MNLSVNSRNRPDDTSVWLIAVNVLQPEETIIAY